MESVPSEVALLDAAGTITWANPAWLRAAQGGSDLLAGCVVGADAVRVMRGSKTPQASAVASGVAAVVAGERGEFEQEFGSADGVRRWRIHANALRRPSRGAVLLRTEITGAAARAPWDLQDPEDLSARIGSVTSRERDVLKLMVRGLNNREIAAELGIGYTTVRSHTQSVIEKLGARSRLDAVARVARGNLGGMMNRTPLGIGNQDVPMPGHLGLFYDAEPDLRRVLLEFVRPALDDPGQGIVLFGPPGIARRMFDNLAADLGRPLTSELESGRILIAHMDRDPDQLLENLRTAIETMAARHSTVIRVFGDVKWGAPGFPLPEDALWVESRVNNMLAGTTAVVVCAYDVSRLPDRALIMGGLKTHPIIVIGDWLKENPNYIPPADYMRALLLQLGSPEPTSGPTSAARRHSE